MDTCVCVCVSVSGGDWMEDLYAILVSVVTWGIPSQLCKGSPIMCQFWPTGGEGV
jgi:hypothetical protein